MGDTMLVPETVLMPAPETTLTPPTAASEVGGVSMIPEKAAGPVASVVLQPIHALCDPGMARLVAMVLAVAITIVILWGLIALAQWIWNTFVNQAVTWSRPITMATALWLFIGVMVLIAVPAILSSLILGLLIGAAVEDTKGELRRRYPGFFHRIYSAILRSYNRM